MSTTVNIERKYVDKRYYERNQDLGIVAGAQTTGNDAVDYSKVMLKNAEKTAYVLDLPFYDISGNQLIKHDTTTDDINVYKPLKVSDDIEAVNGVFSGDVNAVGGIFSGNIQAVQGSFSGAVTIDTILNVRGAIDLADNDILRFGTSDDVEHFFNATYYYTDINTGGKWRVRNGTASKFEFDTLNGRFGINKINPEHALDVAGNGKLTGDLTVGGNITIDGNSRIQINVSDAKYAKIGNNISSLDVLALESMGDVQVTLDSNNNTTGNKFSVVANGTTGTEVFSVNDAGDVDVGNNLTVGGDVGINIAIPAARFQIAGDSGGNHFKVGRSYREMTFTTEINAGSLDSLHRLKIESVSGAFAFSNASREIIRFNNTGNVLIGKTTDDGYKHDVAGTGRYSNNLYLETQASSLSYASGILGAGSIWDFAATGGTFFEIDNMRVRNELRAHIFKKDIVKASNAYLFITDAAEIAETVTIATTADTFKIVDDGTNATFNNGDLLWAKNIQDDGSLQITGVKITVGNQVATGTTNGKNWIEYAITAVANGGALNAGDTIVRVSGGSIMNDASSQYSPFIDIYDGVSTWADFQSVNKVKVRLGNLDGITNTSGYGLYSSKAYLTDSVLIGSLDKTGSYFEVAGSQISAVGLDLDVTSLPRVSDEGLIGLWRFDGEDENNNTIDGTGNNTAVVDIYGTDKGVSGEAFNFTTGAHVVRLSGDGLGDSFSELSISVWLNASNIQADFIYAVHRSIDTAIGSSVYYIGINNWGNLVACIDGDYAAATGIQAQINTWYNVVLIWDGSIVKTYVNGNLEKQYNKSTIGNTIVGADTGIGNAYGGNSSRSFEGLIDEVRFYNRALDEDEIKALYLYPSGNSGGLISANQVRTGLLTSQNYSANSAGTKFDLNAGILEMNFGGANIFEFDSTAGTAKIAGWNFDNTAFYTGTKSLTDGFSTSGITLGGDGSIHTPAFYVNSNGYSGLKQVEQILFKTDATYNWGLRIEDYNIWENNAAGVSSVSINKWGYNKSSTYFRVCNIYNGKGAEVVRIGGTTSVSKFMDVEGVFTAYGTATFTDTVECEKSIEYPKKLISDNTIIHGSYTGDQIYYKLVSYMLINDTEKVLLQGTIKRTYGVDMITYARRDGTNIYLYGMRTDGTLITAGVSSGDSTSHDISIAW